MKEYQRECNSDFKWPSLQRWQCPIDEGTLETFILSIIWKIPVYWHRVCLKVEVLKLKFIIVLQLTTIFRGFFLFKLGDFQKTNPTKILTLKILHVGSLRTLSIQFTLLDLFLIWEEKTAGSWEFKVPCLLLILVSGREKPWFSALTHLSLHTPHPTINTWRSSHFSRALTRPYPPLSVVYR